MLSYFQFETGVENFCRMRRFLTYAPFFLMIAISNHSEANTKNCTTPQEYDERVRQTKSKFLRKHNLNSEEDIDHKLNEKIFIDLHGERFEVPLSYKPLTKNSDLIVSKNNFRFNIVVPSGGPHPYISGPRFFWRCDNKSNQSISVIVKNPFLGRDLSSYTFPYMMWENRLYSGNIYTINIHNEEKHIEKFYKYDLFGSNFTGHEQKPNGSIFYRDLLGDSRQIFIDCHTSNYPAPYNTCRAHVYWKDGLGIQINHLLTEFLPEWNEIFEKVHVILLSWHKKSKTEKDQ